MLRSSTSSVAVFKVVVVPFTVKLPDKVKSAKVGESPVPKSFVFTFTPFILICPWASPSADADTTALVYNFVVIKDMISEFIWYALVGNLVINTSNSYIQSIKCNRSAGELGAYVENQLNNPKKEKKEPSFALGY